MSSIQDRNRSMFERCKSLGDEVYAEDMGLVVRPNLSDTLRDRWGFDVVQTSAWYAVSLAHWCRDYPDTCDEEHHRLNRLLTTMSEQQDRDPGSPTYGNMFWRVGWTEIRDRNGVSFWSPEAGLVFHDYRDLLTDDTADQVETALQLCISGLDLHRPRWQYTNIFLLNILSRLTLSRALERPEVLAQAEHDWHTWYTETGKGGFTEYNSPTYIVTALAPLGRMLDFAPAGMCEEIEQTLSCLYADFCCHYHTPSGGLAGAMSRAYPGDWLHNSMTNHIAHQQLDEPHTAINLTAPFTASSSYLAPEKIREFATRDKSGSTVVATIPDLDIERRTVFGDRFALGTKSGPAYGHQELPLTIAHPGRRQHLIYLHQESLVRCATYADTVGSAALVVMDVPESSPESAPPHAWSKLRLGPADEFTQILVDDAVWNGDYLDLSAHTLGLSTGSVAMRFSFCVFTDPTVEHPTVKTFLWNDYQTDQLTVEIIAWEPTRIAVGVAVTDDDVIPHVCHTRKVKPNTYVAETLGQALKVSIGQTIDTEAPLLDTPGFTWQKQWRATGIQ